MLLNLCAMLKVQKGETIMGYIIGTYGLYPFIIFIIIAIFALMVGFRAFIGIIFLMLMAYFVFEILPNVVLHYWHNPLVGVRE